MPTWMISDVAKASMSGSCRFHGGVGSFGSASHGFGPGGGLHANFGHGSLGGAGIASNGGGAGAAVGGAVEDIVGGVAL